MDKILRKIRWRNIKANLKQFLSVILIMFLSTTLLFGFIVNSNTLNSSIDSYFEKTNLADLWVYADKVTDADKQFFEDNNLKYTERLFMSGEGKLLNQDTTNNTKVYVLPKKTTVSIPYIEKGRPGCLVDKNMAENLGIIINYDDIVFDVEVPISETETVVVPLKLRITGTMNFNECADVYSSWPVVVDETTFILMMNLQLEEMFGTDSFNISKVPYNQIVLKTDNIEETKQKINTYYETSESNLLFLGDRDTVESVVLLNMELSQAQKMIYVFPVIFLIVSVMIILTTINQLILHEKGRIGTLKSIGVPDKKVLNHYSSYGAYLCAIGALVGLLFGPLIVPKVMFIKYNLVYSIPADFIKTQIPWLFAVLVFALMTLLGYVVSVLACYEILHKRPIECMRHQVNIKMKSRNKKSKAPIWVKMAVRNIRVKPVRTVMAMLGVAGCASLLLCGFGIGDTLNHGVKNDFGRLFDYDISSSYVSADFEEKLADIDGIVSYETYQEFSVKAIAGEKSKTISFMTFKADSKFAKFGLGENKMCLSKSVAKELGLKVGDKVVFETESGRAEVVVDKIEKTSFVNGAFATSNFGLTSTMTDHGVWLDCDGNFETIKGQINIISGTNDAGTIDEFVESANEKISSINSITTTLKVFAIMLAVVVLFNLIMLILKERTKDIATMKVVGQHIFAIGLSLIFEVFIISAIGSVLGLVLGFPVLMLVLSINKVQIVNYLYFINPLSYIYTFLIIFGTILVIGLFSLLKVKNINMIESLKSVE